MLKIIPPDHLIIALTSLILTNQVTALVAKEKIKKMEDKMSAEYIVLLLVNKCMIWSINETATVCFWVFILKSVVNDYIVYRHLIS